MRNSKWVQGMRLLAAAALSALPALPALPAPLRQWRQVLRQPAIAVAVLGLLGASLAPPVVSAVALHPSWVELPLVLPASADDQPFVARSAAFAERLQQAYGLSAATADEFAPWILEAATRQELPPGLIAGLIYTESTFRKQARSWAGAIGPAQIKPRWWQGFCNTRDLADPESNVYCGAQVLKHFMQRCGATRCALAQYNVGASNLRDSWYRKAGQRYASKVDRHWETLAATVL